MPCSLDKMNLGESGIFLDTAILLDYLTPLKGLFSATWANFSNVFEQIRINSKKLKEILSNSVKSAKFWKTRTNSRNSEEFDQKQMKFYEFGQNLELIRILPIMFESIP